MKQRTLLGDFLICPCSHRSEKDFAADARQPARAVRDHRAARRGRHGRGLSRARHAARSRRRGQGAARASLREPRHVARGSSARRARSRRSITRTSARCTTSAAKAEPTSSSWSCSRARRSRRGSSRARCPPAEVLHARRPDRRRARQGAPRRHRASRPEAGQRDAHEVRREAHGLRTCARSRRSRAGAERPRRESPTMSRPLTAEGTIVGTFQYMAPEQLEGREADARSRHLGAGLRALRDGDRAARVRRHEPGQPHQLDHEGRAAGRSESCRLARRPALDRLVSACLAKDRRKIGFRPRTT